MARKYIKSRYFDFLLYPESIPEDWEDCLAKLGLPMAVSPLHDLDVTEREYKELKSHEQAIIDAGGVVYKKPHYHVIYVAKNPVTTESVRNKIKRALGGKSVSHIEITDSVEWYFNYLTHDTADARKKHKHLYDKKDITYINDFDIDRYVVLDEGQKRELVGVIFNIVREYQIENMFDLADFIALYGGEYGIQDMGVVDNVIKGNAGILKLYFDGAYQRRKYGANVPKWRKYDKNTGELLEHKGE